MSNGVSNHLRSSVPLLQSLHLIQLFHLINHYDMYESHTTNTRNKATHIECLAPQKYSPHIIKQKITHQKSKKNKLPEKQLMTNASTHVNASIFSRGPTTNTSLAKQS